MLKRLLNLNIIKDRTVEPPYEYEFLAELNEKEYPKYLKRIFKEITGSDLNLKNPKTFNEKIQWLKLYDVSLLKTQLTDKVQARDFVEAQIGAEYLKPVLWIGKNFDDIPFDILPQAFIIKANHGCKWHYKIKNKDKFLKEKQLVDYVKSKFNSWCSMSFFPWAGFEMQYKGIIPQIIIEPLLVEEVNSSPVEYEIYCFNGEPKIYQQITYGKQSASVSVYDKNFNESELLFNPDYIQIKKSADENLKKAVELSKILCKEFKLVRVDWLEYKNNIYFNEMTFTPMSGFYIFNNSKWNIELGRMLKLK